MRPDISEQLVHLTRGSIPEAEAVFRTIIAERKLRGSSAGVRGGHKVVCFSESPIETIARLFDGSVTSFRYRPFGIMFRKSMLFAKGGRPAFYQPESDFQLLPEALQYRHVRFDGPGTAADFTFEREWRIETDEIVLDPNECTLVVPNREWEKKLRV